MRNSLRKKVLFICLIGITCVAGIAAVQAEEPTLVAATDQSFPPFEMMDKETGKVVGFDMQLLAEVADRAGFDYTLRKMPFPGIVPALQTASIDLGIAAIVITEKREKVVDFSIPYYEAGLAILVRSDNDSIESLEDLEGKKVATKIGSSSYMFLTKELADRADIKSYPLTSNMYMGLMSGTVDAVVYDAPNIKYYRMTKGGDKVKIVGPVYDAQYYGITFPEGSKWVDDVNKALRSIIDDGTYVEIFKKWFGDAPPESWDEWLHASAATN